MSYAAVIHYIYEKDTSVTLRSERIETEATIGDSVDFYFYDFETDGVKHYVKYALGNGESFFRGDENNVGADRIYAGSMVISESQYYSHWFVFCTDDENDILGDHHLDECDFVDEIFLSLDGINVNTKGSENTNSISITNGAISEPFVSYGATFSPTLSCDIFNCEFTERLVSGEFYDNVVKGTIVNAWYVIEGQEKYPVIMGRFVVREEPTFTEETVSFRGIGITEAYMETAWVDIEKLNLYHKDEIEEKYVTNGFMAFVEYRSDVYFWEFLPEDFYRATGCPLHIDGWGSIKKMIYDYAIPQLMIPCLESYSQTQITDDNGLIDYEYEREYLPKITWRELISGIAILLRANVIEKNGAFYIKRLPNVKKSGYREIIDSSLYDSSAQFGRNLMCPSDISVNATNWYFYYDISIGKPAGFGYYTGEATVTINNKKSDEIGVTYYPVSIECPWILFETLDRDPSKYRKQKMFLWLGHLENMRWNTALIKFNNAFAYNKANYQTVGWNPALMMAGKMNIVEDYNGEKKYAYIGEITIHYDGSVYADISSPCDVQVDNSAGVSAFSLARGINNQSIKIENVASSGGYNATIYTRNEKANQQGIRSQTISEIKEVENEVEKVTGSITYVSTIPHFEFGTFTDKSMKVTLTEVTE